MWSWTWWIYSHNRRYSHLSQSLRAGYYPARPQTTSSSSYEDQSRSKVNLWLQVRRLHSRRVWSLANNQSTCIRVICLTFLEKPREVFILRLFYFTNFYATVNQNFIFPFSLSKISERVSQSQLPSEISIINASSFKNSKNSLTIFFISSLSDW